MSMAIKYAMSRKAKGSCPGPDCPGCASTMCMAEGGEAGNRSPYEGNTVHPDVSRKDWGSGARPGTSLTGEHVRGAARAHEAGQNKAAASRSESAKNLHKQVLHNLKNDKTDRKYLAEGGMVDDDDDLIGRIMRKRSGEPLADFESNDFDVMDQIPEEHDADYTGANSGDELGNEALDDDEHDLVARIMKSRAKKDRLPRPA